MADPTRLRTPARAVILALATATVLVVQQAPVRAADPDPSPLSTNDIAAATPAPTPSTDAAAVRPSPSPTGSATPTAATSGQKRAAAQGAAAVVARQERNAGSAAQQALPRVTLQFAGSWSAGLPQSLSGTVVAIAPDPVTIDLQSWDGAAWLTRVTTTATDGTFATSWAPTAPGPMTWRAVATQPGIDPLVSSSVVVPVTAQPMITVSTVTAADVAYSYRAGCPVAPSSLRKISLNYWDFGGQVRRGTLIGAVWAVPAYQSVFTTIFDARFPIRQVRPVDYYYYDVKGASAQSDIASMAADNTSAFNCRKVTGDPYRMSRHSWGDAIDFNTVENPYVTAAQVYPAAGRYFLSRKAYREGMILPGSVIATAMARLHWYWGARWSHPDYQHFSSTGQ